jgi:diphthamide synthase (EF-2-diphthine--ammonia ligase)
VDLLAEFIRRRHRAVVVSVDSRLGRRDWLGRELNDDLFEEIRSHDSVDACGEHGEYHTFVFAGPLLSRPLPLRAGAQHEEEGHLQLDLTLGDE